MTRSQLKSTCVLLRKRNPSSALHYDFWKVAGAMLRNPGVAPKHERKRITTQTRRTRSYFMLRYVADVVDQSLSIPVCSEDLNCCGTAQTSSPAPTSAAQQTRPHQWGHSIAFYRSAAWKRLDSPSIHSQSDAQISRHSLHDSRRHPPR